MLDSPSSTLVLHGMTEVQKNPAHENLICPHRLDHALGAVDGGIAWDGKRTFLLYQDVGGNLAVRINDDPTYHTKWVDPMYYPEYKIWGNDTVISQPTTCLLLKTALPMTLVEYRGWTTSQARSLSVQRTRLSLSS